MKKIFLLTIILISVLLLVSPASAWISGYDKRDTINITGNPYWSSDQTDYQIQFLLYNTTGTSSGNTLYLGTGLQADWDDIRFSDSSDNLYNFYVTDTGSNFAVVWVKIPTISVVNTQSIYLYSKNSGATSASNSANTFEFFDHFTEASINATNWVSSGSVSLSSSVVTITGYDSIIYRGAMEYNKGYIFKGKLNSTGIQRISGLVNNMGYAYYQGFYVDSGNVYVYSSNSEIYNNINIGSCNVFRTYGVDYTYSDSYDSKVRMFVNSSNIFETNTVDGSVDVLRFTSSANEDIKLDYVGIVKTSFYLPTVSYITTSAGQTADFTGTPVTGYQNQNVQFTDTSTGSPTSWFWDLNGDGVTDNTTRNCSYTYSTPGSFTVTLIAQKLGINNTKVSSNYVNIYGNVVTSGFTSNITNGAAPFAVQFTSTSTNATSWAWDFQNDGVVDSTLENPTFAFPSVGFWSVKLVASNAYTNDTELKYDYIYVQTSGSANLSGYGGTYPPKEVTFRVQSMFGTPELGATVTAIGVETTTGSWDWLSQILSVKLVETPIQNTTMHGTTGTNGEVSFLMLPSVKYNITVSKTGILPQQLYITPTEQLYIIYATPENAGENIFYGSSYDYNKYITVNITTSEYNTTANYVKIDYIDLLKQTTSAKIYINQSAGIGNETCFYYNTLVLSDGANFTQNILLGNTAGQSYEVKVITQNTLFGQQYKYFAVHFPDAPKIGLPANIVCFFAIFLILFIGMFFGQSSAAQGALIACFLGWIFYSIGWLADLGDTALPALTLATLVSIFGLIAKRKNSED